MNQNIILTLVEFIFSLIVEGVILGFVFQLISNRSDEKQQQALQIELNNIEKQNKFEYEQLKEEIIQARIDIISQIKETHTK